MIRLFPFPIFRANPLRHLQQSPGHKKVDGGAEDGVKEDRHQVVNEDFVVKSVGVLQNYGGQQDKEEH